MSARIAYWTNSFEPEMEAIAAEVATLRHHFPRSAVWGLSRRHWCQLSWRRGWALHPRLHLLFRAATGILERFFQINHIFGSLGDWFYLQGKRQRPTVLTMVAVSEPVPQALLDRVDRFVAECPADYDYLEQLGIEHKRRRLIFPGVDLDRFSPADPPKNPFTVFFASSPERADWLSGRGIPLILEAAALRPQMHFHLLWRPWGNSLPLLQQWISERKLANVKLVVGRAEDMAIHYQSAHVTVAPFTLREQCKAVPNSLLESLACGRPVATTSIVGLAPLIEEHRAGVLHPPSGEGLAEGLDRLQSEWSHFSADARRFAERWLARETFIRSYEHLYGELLAHGKNFTAPVGIGTLGTPYERIGFPTNGALCRTRNLPN